MTNFSTTPLLSSPTRVVDEITPPLTPSQEPPRGIGLQIPRPLSATFNGSRGVEKKKPTLKESHPLCTRVQVRDVMTSNVYFSCSAVHSYARKVILSLTPCLPD